MSARFTFPPRSTRGAVLGFTWSQIGGVVVGLICAMIGINLLAAGHKWAAIAMFGAAVLLIVLALLRLKGRRVTEWLPVIAGALVQKATRQDRYRGGIFAANGGDLLDLPGAAAGYRWLTAVAADGVTQVGLLHHRTEKTVTAALACTGGNFVLADPDDQTRRLTDWAQALNILGSEYADSGLVRWSLSTRTVPDTGNHAQRYLATRAVETSSTAYRSLAELTAAAAPSGQRHDTFLVVVFDIARMSGEIDAAGGTDTAIGVVILERLAGLAATAAEAGVSTHGWLSPRRYAAVRRTQWDPADQEAVDLRGGTTTGHAGTPTEPGVAPGVEPRLAGPLAAETVGWDTYRHDSGLSPTLWVAQMPRQPVGGTWLTPLYTRGSGRRTVTLTAQPVPAALAQLAARRDQVAAAGDEVTKRKLRLVRTAREDEEAKAVLQIDREQAAGHVRYRYQLLITVTADTPDELDRHTRAAKRVLSRAGCEAVTLYGEQDQAFVAGALPLGRGLKPLRGWSA
ncbi:SCO6880 family protein [Dactylosporangium sp. CA-139114]|uniref:SCO6880 family protein n=1 Tax=Dactylosporangium sp. CA-139114 TaxID=3239931 RepID=UPI003D97AF7A